jgi:hypothetical protein
VSSALARVLMLVISVLVGEPEEPVHLLIVTVAAIIKL